MKNSIAVILNGTQVVEYDRNKRLPGRQRQFLDKMDNDMDSGIRINDTYVAKPDAGQRSQYVALQLVKALLEDNDSLIAATCSYLATRLPDLKQIKARQEKDESVSIELVFDRHYSADEKPVSFIKPKTC